MPLLPSFLSRTRTVARLDTRPLALALSLWASLASSVALAEPCPSSGVAAGNGSTFTCANVPTTPKQPTNPAPGARCPSVSDPLLAADLRAMTAARVRDLTIASVAINNKPMKVRVILPRDYEAFNYTTNPGKKWPVLYLLTGHGASYESWTCATTLLRFAKELNVIIVMPEGTVGYMQQANAYKPDELSGLGNAASGVPGWYSDWLYDLVQINNYTVYGPRVRMRLKTHHTEELRDVLNSNFHANNDKYAVAGLSMGGFGATNYALGSTSQRPFVAAASFSGPLDTEYLSANIPYVGGLDMPTVIRGSIEAAQASQGEYVLTGNRLWDEKTSQRWRDNNPKRRVSGGTSTLANMPLYVSTGQGNSRYDIDVLARVSEGNLDAFEVGAYFSTQSFLASLNRTNVTLEYFPRLGHSWRNWDVNLCRALNLTLLAPLNTPQTSVGTPTALSACPAAP